MSFSVLKGAVMTSQQEGMLLGSEAWESGARAWSWKAPEDKNGKPVDPVTIDGIVIDQGTANATDPATGEQKFWKSGNPVLNVILTIQTDVHEDEEDDGIRRLFIQIPSALYVATR